jgi:hypothetical protein
MNKFDAIAPKKPTTLEGRLAQLIRLLCSDREGEVSAAIHAIVRTLKAAGTNSIHALADRIEKGGGNSDASRASLNAAEMQRIYDKAYQKGFADGSEHGRKNAIIAGPSIGTFNIGVNSGVNGYSWREIAQHCAANKHLFYGRNYDFVESVAEQLEYRNTPSPPQAKWLKDLFMRRFDGRID